MMNAYLRIRWMTALITAIILIIAGVLAMFVPVVPEIVVILLGMWLLGTVATNPLHRWQQRHLKKSILNLHKERRR